MDTNLYRQLVDLYAGDELPTELEDQMKAESFTNKDLSHDMNTLRMTVDALRSIPEPDFTEESYQRILMKLYAKGVDVQPRGQAPAHMQYYLPIAG